MQKKKAMKKKADWITKAKKRKTKKEDRGIVDCQTAGKIPKGIRMSQLLMYQCYPNHKVISLIKMTNKRNGNRLFSL